MIDTTFSPWIKHCETRTLSGSKGHLTYLEYSKLFTNLRRPQPTRWFTVIRNPWDWHVSWFHYIKGDANGRHSGMQLEASLFQNFSFADYVNWLEDPAAPCSPQRYMHKEQRDYLVGSDGAVAVQHILRQESLDADLRDLVDTLKLNVHLPSGRFNASQRSPDYRQYYNDETAAIIARRHSHDISLWKYQF